MFFVLSKVFWTVAQPLTAATLVLIVGFGLALFRFRRSGLSLIGLGLFVLVLSGFTNLGEVLMQPLENRFARPAEAPQDVSGIIVLGGGIDGVVSGARGVEELNAGGDRFVEAARLARRYPEARIVVTGGHGTLTRMGETDAIVARRLYDGLGLDPTRLLFEGESRNTEENAQFTRELLQPQAGQRFLLVTSAFHMPRSMGLFRKAGIDVIAWPVDYRTTGERWLEAELFNPPSNMDVLSFAIREWVGLAAYSVTGKIDELFPAP